LATSQQDGGMTSTMITVADYSVSLWVGKLGGTGNIDGVGSAARFGFIEKVFTSDGARLFVSDNDAIRLLLIDSRVLTTLAGTPGFRGTSDGQGSIAGFQDPAGLAFESSAGYLYVADDGNNAIRRVAFHNSPSTDGTTTTFAGSTVGGQGYAE